MGLQVFLIRFVGILDAAGIPYMICGSVASTFHSAPRTTQDIDIVVELDQGRLVALLAHLPGEAYYVSEQAAHDALRRRSIFNVIDLDTGWKADLVVRKGRPFSAKEFGRRLQVEFMGVSLWIASAEDCVISKLEWAALGASERQLGDVRSIVDVQGERLDRAYIEHWVGELGLRNGWRKVLEAR
jgi:hypothetical protein